MVSLPSFFKPKNVSLISLSLYQPDRPARGQDWSQGIAEATSCHWCPADNCAVCLLCSLFIAQGHPSAGQPRGGLTWRQHLFLTPAKAPQRLKAAGPPPAWVSYFLWKAADTFLISQKAAKEYTRFLLLLFIHYCLSSLFLRTDEQPTFLQTQGAIDQLNNFQILVALIILYSTHDNNLSC